MTFVFRTSSFFVIFVITVKATTFVVGSTVSGPAGGNSNNATDRLNDRVERLVDEAVRFRGEASEAADKVMDMAFALHILGDRMIERVLSAARVAVGRTHSAMRNIMHSPCVNVGTATRTLHNLRSAMPKKEDHHDGYTTAGQRGQSSALG
ncbi:conserved protein of unknown function [Acidithiobacillus ferrivorans]|uniref:Uncharacterized protein n=1 Tax=Acidithiobacillus ferrivorans TaxID=160808 RepID=A0A060UQ38_9PROT|nr:hypothetical protein [Acidithiobacillus ferrivorans]CDQ10520.1 conserved hypothetical protein [Acidithiobacillus ferrivorans]SMH64549.1 conserved protein of unknown function [Acidithiobacillus ferrivorans]